MPGPKEPKPGERPPKRDDREARGAKLEDPRRETRSGIDEPAAPAPDEIEPSVHQNQPGLGDESGHS